MKIRLGSFGCGGSTNRVSNDGTAGSRPVGRIEGRRSDSPRSVENQIPISIEEERHEDAKAGCLELAVEERVRHGRIAANTASREKAARTRIFRVASKTRFLSVVQPGSNNETLPQSSLRSAHGSTHGLGYAFVGCTCRAGQSDQWLSPVFSAIEHYNAYRTSRPTCKAMVAPGRHRLLRSVPVRPPAPSPRVEDFDRRQRGRMIVVEQARAISSPPAASAPPITFSGCIRPSCWSGRAI